MSDTEIRDLAENTKLAGDVEELMLTIRVAVGDLGGHLNAAAANLQRAARSTNELITFYAIEYTEGTTGDDIRRHLEDAARSIRAATALHRLAARATLEG